MNTHSPLSAEQLENFLRAHIPAVELLNLRIAECTPNRVVLNVPFDLNRNHKATVFGGSQALAATLAGWSLVHVALPEAHGNIVIQESNIRYLKPATGDLCVIARAQNDADWQPFQAAFGAKGKSRIWLQVDLLCGGETVSEFQGKFVALSAQ